MKIKAALYANGNEDKLLQMAVDAFKPDLKTITGHCTECYEEVSVSFIDYKENGTVIHNVPAYVCRSCNHTSMNFFLMGALSEVMESLPEKEADFSQLV